MICEEIIICLKEVRTSMKGAVISIVFLLGFFLSGCSDAGDGVATDRLLLTIKDVSFSSRGIIIKYELNNSGSTFAYSAFIGDENVENSWPKVPFIRFNAENGNLEVSAFVAKLPADRLIEAPYRHDFIKILPGAREMEVTIVNPLQESLPYPTSAPEPINRNEIRAIKLTLGYFQCPFLRDYPQKYDMNTIEISAGDVILCEESERAALELQRYASDEYVIAPFTVAPSADRR